MTSRAIRTGMILSVIGVVAAMNGCVRRTLTVNTTPQGAIVWLNDEEIGRAPVSVDFLWYGDYEVIARLDGHETLVTHQEIKAPWYQWPGIDFFSEVLYPFWIHDARTMEFTLSEEIVPDRQELLERAQEFSADAVAETQ